VSAGVAPDDSSQLALL